MAARKYRKPTQAQRDAAQAKRDGILQELAEGIARLTTSAEWARYLDVQARFRRYSFSNTMLILCQMPTATQVMAYGARDNSTGWRSLGRNVIKGEHGLCIWAPHKVKIEKTEDADEGSGQAEQTRFHLTTVFDISQTEGEPLPEPVKLLEGEDAAGVFGQLVTVAGGFGFRVQVTPEIDGHPGANGLCEFLASGPLLTVAGNRSPLQQVKSLAHEIAHALLHKGSDLARGRKELEAESAAYVICQSLGLDTSGYTFGYVAFWQGGDAGKARDAIKASGKAISTASRKILDALDSAADAVADLAA